MGTRFQKTELTRKGGRQLKNSRAIFFTFLDLSNKTRGMHNFGWNSQSKTLILLTLDRTQCKHVELE